MAGDAGVEPLEDPHRDGAERGLAGQTGRPQRLGADRWRRSGLRATECGGDAPINLFSLIGLLMLIGLVSKNAILLVDRAEHLRRWSWVREFADRFHSFYHDCYVVHSENTPQITQARLWLVEAARVGLAIALELLGVAAPETM